MEWGPNWLKPIQERLAVKYPHLNVEELDAYQAVCRSAMNFGHEQVPEHWHAAGGDQAEAERRSQQAVLARYPWVSPANLSHLFSQGCYYAWKDGAIG